MPSNFNEQTGMVETLMQRYEREGQTESDRDSCSRQCEGTAYRIQARMLAREVEELKAAIAQAKCDANGEYERGMNEAHDVIAKQINTQSKKFIHKKTGNHYYRIAHGIVLYQCQRRYASCHLLQRR